MGTYLSTPVTEKCHEAEEDLECRPFPITWAVVDMQGWRKSMEDAHIARTRVPLRLSSDNTAEEDGPNSSPVVNNDIQDAAAAAATAPIGETAKVFGVFDGHGGAE